MHFNFVRTLSFPCLRSFQCFTPRGVEPRSHSLCCWHPAEFREYYSHSSLPFVACPLHSSQPSPNVRLPVAVHCLQSNGAPQVFPEPSKTRVPIRRLVRPSRPLFPAVESNPCESFKCLGGNFHLSCHVPRYASFPVIFFTLLTGGTVRTTTFCH